MTKKVRYHYWLRSRDRLIAQILQKEESERTIEEKTSLAFFKQDIRQKVSYQEYVFLLKTNDELMFDYRDVSYGNVYGVRKNKVTFCRIINPGTEQESGSCEHFSDIEEMLAKVRIEGKTIEEIWEDAVLG